MSIIPQQDLFGNLSYDVEVMPTARRIMNEKPVTYQSHRMLMREVAKEMSFNWLVKLTSEELHQLDTLLDLSPDFERAARKVREEDEAREHRARTGQLAAI